MQKLSIDFICPPQTTLDVDGVEFTVRAITMRQLPALVRCIQPALDDVIALMNDSSIEAAVRLVGQHGDAVTEAVALCTGTELKIIEAMTPDRVAVLLLVCCEVNSDFFAQAVPSIKAQAGQAAPLLVTKWSGLLQRLPMIGQQPLTGSSLPATGTAKS
jgi:hypothetical protein